MSIELKNGDCLELLKELPNNSVDLCLTDPPYKLSQKYTSVTDSDNVIAVASIYLCAVELKRVVKHGKFCIIFYDNRLLPMALDAFKKAGWKYVRALTYYRREGSAHMMCGWMSTSDFILIFQNGDGKMEFFGDCHHDVYVRMGREKISFNHPAQKPEWVIEHIIQRVTQEGDTILDPYFGSGTVPSVAKSLGRNCIGYELEKQFYDIGYERTFQIADEGSKGKRGGFLKLFEDEAQ